MQLKMLLCKDAKLLMTANLPGKIETEGADPVRFDQLFRAADGLEDGPKDLATFLLPMRKTKNRE